MIVEGISYGIHDSRIKFFLMIFKLYLAVLLLVFLCSPFFKDSFLRHL